jgi:hypothetical protein
MAPSTPDQPAAELTAEEGVRYEVAEDLYGDLIGWCAEQAAAERAKPDPDPAELQRFKDQAILYVAERRALDPRDAAAVGAAVTKYSALVREIRSERWADDR